MNQPGVDIRLDLSMLQRSLDQIQAALARPTDLMRGIAKSLEGITEANFVAGGQPAWAPLQPATIAQRLRRSKGGSVLKILVDTGVLSEGITSRFSDTEAVIGSPTVYAAIHQFGGTISVPAKPFKVRLQTGRNGDLVRQKGYPNLAKFAGSKGGKEAPQYTERSGMAPAHTIGIPARPFLPFSGQPNAAVLQPQAETAILALIDSYLTSALS